MQSKYTTSSQDESIILAKKIGEQLKGGEIIAINSDLGGGKTTFTKGIVKGAGSNDNVSSPSFNIKNEYVSNKFNIFHYDFYRLQDPGLMKNELDEAINEQNAVIILEWSITVKDVLPQDIIELTIKVTGKLGRQLIFNYPSKYEYLFKAIK